MCTQYTLFVVARSYLSCAKRHGILNQATSMRRSNTKRWPMPVMVLTSLGPVWCSEPVNQARLPCKKLGFIEVCFRLCYFLKLSKAYMQGSTANTLTVNHADGMETSGFISDIYHLK